MERPPLALDSDFEDESDTDLIETKHWYNTIRKCPDYTTKEVHYQDYPPKKDLTPYPFTGIKLHQDQAWIEYEVLRYEYDYDDVFMPRVYAFTWNPNPERYPSASPTKQYRMLIRYALKYADKVWDKFVITPELTSDGNIHIHGWFTMKDKIKFYKSFLPKLRNLGFVKIKYGKVNSSWCQNYILKDIEYMAQILDPNKVPVPLTTYNFDGYVKYNRYYWCRQGPKPKLKYHPRALLYKYKFIK